MARVEFDIDTPLPPERVVSGLTNFSELRPEIWPGIHPSLYEVRNLGTTSADVKEGTKAPGMTVWAVEHYDWSVPGTVTWTVQESNFCTPGSSVSARISQGQEGGSRIHITWDRTPVGFKARLMFAMIKLSGGKPVEASFRQGLDRMLENDRSA
ncbi:MAG TPA: SRPBCC family protein [Rubrobacter sp.]